MSEIRIPWQATLDGPRSGAENMAIDLEMFKTCNAPKVRIYSWKNKCISYGYAQKIDELINMEKAKQDGWDIVKRPTGGGIVYHSTDEVTYCVVCPLQLLPKGLMGSYYYISDIIVRALRSLGVEAKMGDREPGPGNRDADCGLRSTVYGTPQNELCFSNTREYEVTVDGKKLVGSAQKRGRHAMLQQGSVQFSGMCLENPPHFNEIASALRDVFNMFSR